MTTETMAAAPGGETRSVDSSDQIAVSETDCSRLSMFLHTGQHSARARTRAQVLLKLGDGWSLAEVCRAFDVCRNTVLNVRARFAEGGVDAVLAIEVEAGQIRHMRAISNPDTLARLNAVGLPDHDEPHHRGA